MKQLIPSYLEILNTIIHNEPRYFELYSYVYLLKTTKGSAFSNFTYEGLPNLLLVLEKIELPDSKNNKRPDVNAFSALNALTTDFSVLSGMTPSTWHDFAIYLFESNLRIHAPIQARSITQEQHHSAISALLEYPWCLVILLLEILPLYTVD